MKTIFETNSRTGKISLRLEATSDLERSLLNKLMSTTFEERQNNCHFRIDRVKQPLPNGTQSMAAIISKPAYLNYKILRSMDFVFKKIEKPHWIKLYFNYNLNCLIDLQGISRVWYL